MLVKRHCTIALVLCFSYLKWVKSSGLGPCPRIDSASAINKTKFAGVWYEIERSFYLMELVSSCVTIDLRESYRGHFDVVVNAKSAWTGSFSISDGIAIPLRRDPSIYLYKVNSNLPRILSRYLPGAGFYQVLKTDYSNYAVIYTCTNYQVVHVDMVWIWGRKTEINAELRSDLYALLNTYEIDTDRLILSKNENCTDEVDEDLYEYWD
ncbi:apolipoprotein D-like [Diabrotica undecimpunctata]|uniref:apolipoprotein D-like n=1 Tax=Diabrotica undecimpunctata TaxID=50387 RepID=UPI003B635CE9